MENAYVVNAIMYLFPINLRVGQEPLRILPPSHMNVDGDRDVHPTKLQVAGVARWHPCPSEEHGGAVGGSSTKMEQDAPEPGESATWFLFPFLFRDL